MTQYNCLNIKLFNPQFNKSKSALKNVTAIGNYNREINFPYKLLLSDKQVSKVCKAFRNNLSVNIKSSKTQLSKIIQSSRFLEPVLKIDLPVMEKKLKPLTESILITLALTAGATSEDAGIHKKFHFGKAENWKIL